MNVVALLPDGVATSDRVEPAGRWVAGAVASVLAAERSGAPAVAVGPAPSGVVAALWQHRVTTLVAGHAESLGLPPSPARRLVAARMRSVTEGLQMVAHTRAASTALRTAGVDHLLVKGIALASLVGRGAASRGVGDIDVWVRPGDLGPASSALAAAGWDRRPSAAGLPEVGPGWRWALVEQLNKELALEHPERVKLDLHWRLAEDPADLSFGFDEAWAASVPVDEVGEGVRGLCARHAFEHVAYHARRDHFRILRQCVDVADLADSCGPEAVADMAQRLPNVALALEAAAPVAPWLGGIAPRSRRIERLAAEVHRDLGSLQWTHWAELATRGASRVAARRRRESWLVRSAPQRSSAIRHVALRLVPVRLLTDAAPLRARRRPTGEPSTG